MNLITCQAEKGMTWREWVLSDYYNEEINRILTIGPQMNDFKYEIETYTNESSTNEIYHLSGVYFAPRIYVNSVIESTHYTAYSGGAIP